MNEQIYEYERLVLNGHEDELARVTLPKVQRKQVCSAAQVFLTRRELSAFVSAAKVLRDPSGADVWYPVIEVLTQEELAYRESE